MTALAGWENFYVIVGSSAGALIGLMFVVMALIADLPRAPGTAQASSAFATPTFVHFGAVLLLSAVLCAPWHRVGAAAVLWSLLGIHNAWDIVTYHVFVSKRGQTEAERQR
jgi:hypothetical protein